MALLALMLLQHSRRDARVGGDGRLVLLADQDRGRWRRDEIDEALALLADPALAGPVSPLAASYLLQARIAAEHATAASPEDTRWDRIVEHYDLLLRLVPSPSARLARAVAVAEASGPRRGTRRARRHRDPRQPPRPPPSAPSCWPGVATRTRPGPPTTRRSRRAATTPNGRTCSSGSGPSRGVELRDRLNHPDRAQLSAEVRSSAACTAWS